MTGGIGVLAVKLSANDIGFKSTHEGWEATNVQDALNDLYQIGEYKVTSDTYFYDSSTSGDSIVRYKKIDGMYYLCDENGNITNDEVQDITNVTLVEYKTAASTNLTVGAAGFSDGQFLLGNGTGNGYRVDITITCYFNTYNGYTPTSSTAIRNTRTHSILIYDLENINYENLALNTVYSGGHINGTASGTPAGFYTIDNVSITKLQ